MSDNLPVSGGSGYTIGMDECTVNAILVKLQEVKIALGAKGAFQQFLTNGQATAANSIPVVACSDLSATIPTIGSNKAVQVTEDFGYYLWQGAAYQITVIPVSATASGDNTIVGAVTSKQIHVCFYLLSFSGTVNAKWMSDTGGGATALTDLTYGVLGTIDRCPRGSADFETVSGKALNLNLSAATAVRGYVAYFSH